MNEFTEKRRQLLSYRSKRRDNASAGSVSWHLKQVLDAGTFTEMFPALHTLDPLSFPGYGAKRDAAEKKTQAKCGCIIGTGEIGGIPVVAGELSKNYMMGSMGSAEGEKLTRAFEEADRRRVPLILFSASGGARMQEGMFSLLQMAKTSAACQSFRDHGGLYISVLCHPTTGGVSASYASLGDIILAEPGALIGFAGPRVIEQTIGERLPAGFQRAEFQREHGFVDQVVPMEEMAGRLAQILCLHIRPEEGKIRHPHFLPAESRVPGSVHQAEERDISGRDAIADKSRDEGADETAGSRAGEPLTPHDRVMIARDVRSPRITDFIGGVFDEFVELAGDRLGREDPAILGGIASIGGIPVTVIGHRRGRTILCNN